MVAHGGFADEQPFSDLLILESLADEPDNLALSTGQGSDFLGLRIRSPRLISLRHLVQDACRQRAIEPHLTGVDLLNGLYEDLRRLVF